MDQAKVGAAALAASPPDAEKAVVAYTKALIEHPTSPDYFIQRSIAFNRLKRNDLAIQDADFGVLCGQKRGKRDKIQAAQQRRVVALYNLGRYADAKLVLEKMKHWRPKESKKDEMEHNVWMSKIEKKLKEEPQEVVVTEYPTVTLPEEKELQKLLKKQIKPDGTFNYDEESVDTDMVDVDEKSGSAPSAQSGAPALSSSGRTATGGAPSAPQKIRHEWYQNNQNVIVTIYVKGVQKDKADIDIEADSVSVSFPHPSDTSSSFNLSFDPLYALIVPSQSKYQVMSTKVEITLAKATPGQKWSNVEGSAPLQKADNTSEESDAAKAAVISSLQQPSVAAAKAPSYPTSSKNGPKNWDKLADDLTAKKPKKAKKKTENGEKDGSDSEDMDDGYDSDYGGDQVDGFFKKLFKSSDPDTQRAMAKSFQESNGTALSTNWADVGSRHVDEVKSKDDKDD